MHSLSIQSNRCQYRTIKSRPARTEGRAYFCTGVGVVYLARAMLSMMAALSLIEVKLVIGCGGLSPVSVTGMSAYLSKLIPTLWWSLNSSSAVEFVLSSGAW